MSTLRGMRVAVIVADGFEQIELDAPLEALRTAGLAIDVLAPDEDHKEHVRGVNHLDPGPGVKPDRLLAEAIAQTFDALLIPGGLASPDTMRASESHLAFVRSFAARNKPIGAICHGPWVLADADVVRGRTLTSWPAIRRDLERAGAKWVDREVVIDGKLVTSRKPDDLPAFNRAFLEVLERDYPQLSQPTAGEIEAGRATAPSHL